MVIYQVGRWLEGNWALSKRKVTRQDTFVRHPTANNTVHTQAIPVHTGNRQLIQSAIETTDMPGRDIMALHVTGAFGVLNDVRHMQGDKLVKLVMNTGQELVTMHIHGQTQI